MCVTALRTGKNNNYRRIKKGNYDKFDRLELSFYNIPHQRTKEPLHKPKFSPSMIRKTPTSKNDDQEYVHPNKLTSDEKETPSFLSGEATNKIFTKDATE